MNLLMLLLKLHNTSGDMIGGLASTLYLYLSQTVYILG